MAHGNAEHGMSKWRLAGFAVGFFSLLALALLKAFEPIMGYTTPNWVFFIAGIAAVAAVWFCWLHDTTAATNTRKLR